MTWISVTTGTIQAHQNVTCFASDLEEEVGRLGPRSGVLSLGAKQKRKLVQTHD
jgi:hypothetical protein